METQTQAPRVRVAVGGNRAVEISGQGTYQQGLVDAVRMLADSFTCMVPDYLLGEDDCVQLWPLSVQISHPGSLQDPVRIDVTGWAGESGQRIQTTVEASFDDVAP